MARRRECTKIFLTIIFYGLTLSVSPVSQAKASDTFGDNMQYDTLRSDTTSFFEKREPLMKAGRIPFFGTWSDYFSAYLKINPDSTFQFSWGYNGKSCWTNGKWDRRKDTFYFRANPAYENIKTQYACPFPYKLCYFKNKFYHIEGKGSLIKGKIPSPYMGKKSPLFKTFYFREKRFNLDYFDSSYYKGVSKHAFRMGTGINNVFQPVTGYPAVYSFGFIFSARYIFARKENTYLSLGTPLTLGFSGTSNSTSRTPTLGIMLDLPLIFNYNYEFGSLKNGGSRFGYFVGGGGAYHLNTYSVSRDPSIDIRQVNGFEPVANAGIRYSLGKYRIRNFELRFSYMKMIVESRPDIFGIGFIVNF